MWPVATISVNTHISISITAEALLAHYLPGLVLCARGLARKTAQLCPHGSLSQIGETDIQTELEYGVILGLVQLHCMEPGRTWVLVPSWVPAAGGLLVRTSCLSRNQCHGIITTSCKETNPNWPRFSRKGLHSRKFNFFIHSANVYWMSALYQACYMS